MTSTRKLFDDLTGDAPPSTVDVPGIVRRQKRRRSLLRTGVPTAAALAAVVTVVAFNHDGGPVRGPSAQTVTPAVTRPAATPPPPGFRLVASDRAHFETTAASLRAALDDAVRLAAPGAMWLTEGLTRNATPDGQPPRMVGDTLKLPAGPMFTGTTGVRLQGRRGTLRLTVVGLDPCTPAASCPPKTRDQIRDRRDLEAALYACHADAVKCSVSPRHGRRQRVQTTTSLGGFLSQETTVELADGRALLLTVDNQFIPPGTDNRNKVAQRTTPLSPAQVTTIATTIGDQILP